MTYKAIVSKITVRPHPNADSIQLGTCRGNQVVVGMDTKTGDLGCFFNTDGQLSMQFAEANNLIAVHDAAGKKIGGGFFDDNRRVRSQKFRGERSDGYWVPLSFFNYLGNVPELRQEGFEFDELKGQPICNKYVTEATARAIRNQQARPRKSNIMFAKHFETEKWREQNYKIQPGSLIVITEKLHGTSHRLAKVLRQKVYTGWRKVLVDLASRLGLAPKLEWIIVHGTRNTVLNDELTDAYYGTDFRANATRFLEPNLRKGEVIYGEIVGFVDDDKMVMERQDTEKLKDKAIFKKYGGKMAYAYGQARGTCKFYVYRITQVNEDGDAVDLSWTQVKARCSELGVSHVPELTGPFHMLTGDAFPAHLNDLNTAIENTYVEGPSTLDSSHIREGVCVRVEHEKGSFILKSKSFLFGLLEGYLKERSDVVDTEEAA